ncbi:methylase [Rhodococcus sp. 14-2470-1b]|uniref:HemK2/MTQ2 family protein methyltransferase n=1 Tax=Rhodococcus sp. 14-2470-1b TaxID=2023149 RepID=UPI000B9B821C|nr:HemK2/MTQ2 family protein methyltransferase [Rhodococcus sp. 14-2470-1b]OZF57691.1 methylase [Rhodococcus sp. 14-2470-1b]
MTTLESGRPRVDADPGVYTPQQDTWMLCDAVAASGAAHGARVLDMCTGSGAVAIAAARAGAREVVAFDLSPRAVECASRNAAAAGFDVDVRLGSFIEALTVPPFDVLLCNPPYVPSPDTPAGTGLERAWNAGTDGRFVLDPLCENAHRLLNPGGVLLVVQSDCADPARTLTLLSESGFAARVVAAQRHRFGPVMASRAPYLAAEGHIAPGADTEKFVVIEAHLTSSNAGTQ